MSSDKSPLKDIAEGATKGALEWTEEKLKEVITKFKNRKLAFIEDVKVINLAKEQRTKPEWDFFKEHVKDEELRILFQMGLTLRELEKEDKIPELDSLKNKIYKKYEKRGLHIAQMVQNGIFGRYLGSVLERVTTTEKLKIEIENLFKNIENTIAFIQVDDNVNKKSSEIVSKIQSHSPKTFIISSAGSAMEKCEVIEKNVMKKISGYASELNKTKDRRIYFISKID